MHESKTRGVSSTMQLLQPTALQLLLSHQNELEAPMGGNIGNAATEIALEWRKKKKNPDWLIMELSSYQLETAPEISPKIGIWTNLTPDHLERHGSVEVYSKIKHDLSKGLKYVFITLMMSF